MTLKEKIIDVLSDGKEKSLKDIYAAIDAKPAAIRAVLNASVKSGKTFARTGKGAYSLIK